MFGVGLELIAIQNLVDHIAVATPLLTYLYEY